MARFRRLKDALNDLSTAFTLAQGFLWVVGVLFGIGVMGLVAAWYGASPMTAIAYGLAAAHLGVWLVIAYWLLKSSIEIEFKPGEHEAYFREFGLQGGGSGRLARIRLKVHGSDALEDIKVRLDGIKDCPDELKGVIPFSLHFKDDNIAPFKTEMTLNAEDDQFVDVVTWIWDGRNRPVLSFPTAMQKPVQVPLKEYEIKLLVTGKNIRSISRRFWIGIGTYDDKQIGMTQGKFSMRPLD